MTTFTTNPATPPTMVGSQRLGKRSLANATHNGAIAPATRQPRSPALIAGRKSVFRPARLAKARQPTMSTPATGADDQNSSPRQPARCVATATAAAVITPLVRMRYQGTIENLHLVSIRI